MLGFLPRLGVRVTDLGPGTAVVSRRGGRTGVPLVAGADPLVKSGDRYAVSRLAEDAWLVLGQGSRCSPRPSGG